MSATIIASSKPDEYFGTYISFVPSVMYPDRITKTWNVLGRESVRLGVVKWYGAWRKYAFFPQPETIFEEDCLHQLAEFVEARTREHKV